MSWHRPCRFCSWRTTLRPRTHGVASSYQYAVSPSPKGNTLPRITYSYDRQDVRVEELAMLLGSCWQPVNSEQGLTTRLVMAGADSRRVGTALDNSVALVAAFAREDQLPCVQPGTANFEEGDEETWQWVAARRRRTCQRRLVGFARAIGDTTLVATIHDVVVLPELQGVGLGRSLLRRLASQICRLGATDIGALVPPQTEAFFHACAFAPDREGSQPMAWTPPSERGHHLDWPTFQPDVRLHELLQTKLAAPKSMDTSRTRSNNRT
ncbi:hypothetical protein WJX72_008304 [[Myrmecia] bisecta]|uniref:N-acetyltransferase domain-containing protein n=1 Tax=[Myrmecia] bisecta TaxID=41462 RepID=A0AAW1Q7T1_9CHLO